MHWRDAFRFVPILLMLEILSRLFVGFMPTDHSLDLTIASMATVLMAIRERRP